MQQPEGFEITGPQGETLVCRLKKSLYGTKQASRNWNDALCDVLVNLGFLQSLVDPGVFTCIVQDCIYIILVYVDDMIIAGPDINWIEDFKKRIKERFTIKDLGEARWVLGISVDIDHNKKAITIHQAKYIDDMLQRYQMEDCKPVDTPMAFGRTEDSSMQLEEKNAQLFRSILGSLMYVMVCTRPDIGFAVSSLSKHMNNPQHQHLVAAKHVLRYLKGTRTTGLQYSGGTDMTFTCYSDAD